MRVAIEIVPSSYLAPHRLWLLLGVAALAALYLVAQRRRRAYEVRFTNLALLDVVAPRRPGWRRHVPAALLLVALAGLVVSVAQPTAEVRVPRERATVMLAIDTSISMEATDVAPSRLEAAQQAARAFVEELPEKINLGLVSFDGVARIHVAPTTDRAAVLAAIDGLQLNERTAIGEAIFASLEAIAQAARTEDGGDTPVPAAIVLMSDGKRTAGRTNESAVAAAQSAEVPVSTIAFGTEAGEIYSPEEVFPIPVPVEPGPLRDIADATGGTFFEAESLDQLAAVYRDIGSAIGFDTEEQEVTVRYVWVGLALASAAAALSLVWFSRLP